MKKICGFLSMVACACVVAACDLQPRITSLPDSVGDFISDRYPALLADPDTQPEIYNSAASDYGVYASPELYGTVASDDYIMYSDINDYMFPAQPADNNTGASVDTTQAEIVAEYSSPEPKTESVAEPEPVPVADDYLVVPMYGGATDSHQIKVGAGDTLYAIARRYGTTVADIAKMNNLSAPHAIRAGQKLRVPGNGDIVVAADRVASPAKVTAPENKTEPIPPVAMPRAPAPVVTPTKTAEPAKAPTPARVQLQTLTVGAGDTLYSISRRYSVPVNDLAVMNNLSAPFRLTVGQKLKVPNLSAAAAAASADKEVAAVATTAPAPASVAQKPTPTKTEQNKTTKKPDAKKDTTKKTETQKPATATKQKISSDPKQKLPTIAARSSSKFSWPVRGKILSGFGTKPNGLVNDGINIAASRGTAVKAAENGVVAYAGNEVKGMGNLIILQHFGGWMTVYAHLDSIGLRRGAKVSVGQKIGTVGTSGKVDQPQLHFEIRKGTKAYNPAQQLKK